MTDVEVIQGGTLKAGDTGPNLRLRLISDDGNPENLTGFTGTIRMQLSDEESNTVDDSVSIFDAERGIVSYDWQSNDTDAEGIYEAEVEMTDGTDTISYPNDYFFRVKIMENLQ